MQASPVFDRLAGLPDRIKLPISFEPAALVADLERVLRVAWTAHFVRQNYQGDWSALPLRCPAGAQHPILQIAVPPDCTDWVETEWIPHCPAIRDALRQFNTPLRAARLMRLGAGSQILEHSDPDLDAALGMARLHVPIVTNPDVEFCVNDNPVAMEVGECWYLRLSDPHRVDNRGATPRIHLVFDVDVNDWFADLLTEAAAQQ